MPSLGPLILEPGDQLGRLRLDTDAAAFVIGGRVRALILRSCGLASLPDSLGNLVALEEMDLGGNRLTRLPEALGHLCRLTHLYLYGNAFDMRPESLGALTELRVLDLSSQPSARRAPRLAREPGEPRLPVRERAPADPTSAARRAVRPHIPQRQRQPV